MKDEYHKNKVAVGLNLQSLGSISPMKEQIYDNYCTKKQWLNIAPTLAQQLLLVDEIMRAGKGMGGGSKLGPWCNIANVIQKLFLYVYQWSSFVSTIFISTNPEPRAYNFLKLSKL